MQKRLENLKEYLAAGYYEVPDGSPFVRYSRGLRRYFENRGLPEYNGEELYPCGSFKTKMDVSYNFSYTVGVAWDSMENKDKETAEILKKELCKFRSLVPDEHTVGGSMYTHSFANFRRIIREGLNSYQNRINKMKDNDMRSGLSDVLAGIRSFHSRSLELLLKRGAKESRLYKALQKVPFEPAETLYEAIVSWNFIYYMDGCDNIGHLDADLIDFYRGEDMTDVFRCLFMNIDANEGWSGALGPDYNQLTLQCLHACKGMRRPSLELRITPDMPEEIWDAAIDSIKAGGGSPSLYNEEAYQGILEKLFPEIPKEDRMRFCGGGCTETMLTGISNVGSLDAGVNLALIFEKYMQEKIEKAGSFDEFYDGFIKVCHKEIEKVLDSVSESQKMRAEYLPQPVRTLLVDDCIDREKDFNSGGARYSWSVINLAGLINVLDSMLVIRQLVFNERVMDGKSVKERMQNGERFLEYSSVPRHGIDSDEANSMALRLSEDICTAFDGKVPYLGGKFLPSSIQFATYTDAGKPVGATPDGRLKGEPLCDSVGAIHGNDKLGATALLNSAASLCQSKMAGTPVLNIKLNPNHALGNFKALVKGYFQNGGMQMQITCVSREDMTDAQKNPEKHQNLIVRVGGFSEYFTRLSPELQQAVIDRTLCEM